MKKVFLNTLKYTLWGIVALLITMVPDCATAQSLSNLWQQEKKAEKNDLPQSQIKVLRQIEEKATKEKAFGHILKAQVKEMQVLHRISPDSLGPAVKRLEAKEEVAGDATLRAVYDAILATVYENFNQLTDKAKEKADYYKKKAMANPDALAQSKDESYEPIAVRGRNANIFNNDMLSVIGFAVEDYKTLYEYYNQTGNRRATCIAALKWVLKTGKGHESRELKKSYFRVQLDSLIHLFSDIDVAGEVAVERYNYMSSCEDVTVEDRIHYIHYALSRWGQWQRMGELRAEEKQLTAPSVSFRMKRNLVRSNEKTVLYLEHIRNLKTISMKLYKVNNADGNTSLSPNEARDYEQIRKRLTPLNGHGRTVSCIQGAPWATNNDSVVLDLLPKGVYMIEATTNATDDTWRELLFVSDIQCISQKLPGEKTRFIVVDALSGHPLPYAKVSVGDEAEKTVTLTCNAKGETIYTGKGRAVYACTDNDKAFPKWYSYTTYSYRHWEDRQPRSHIYTDRSIYRPGQTVEVAVVVSRIKNDGFGEALPNHKTEILLKDTNNKTVASRTVTTDSYGTCSTSFNLPQGLLTGHFRIQAGNTLKTIRVEEYKRPTFTIEFPEVNEKYQPGDTLIVNAKAITYSGIAVQGAKVRYTVTRRLPFWWYRNLLPTDLPTDNDRTVWEEETTTGSDGSFRLEMPLTLPENVTSLLESGYTPARFFNFETTVTVTDISGETHEGTMTIPLGTKPTAFSCNLPTQVLTDHETTVDFRLQNASGIKIQAPVDFYIDVPQNCYQTLTTESFPLKAARLNSGKHLLVAWCEGDTLRREFTAFSLNDTKPASDTRQWTYLSASRFPNDGSPVTLQVGSSEENVHVVYAIFSGNQVIEQGDTDISNALINRKLTYKADYGDGLTVSYAWVKNDVIHTYVATIGKPLPERNLNLQWSTFRDRLTPGQKEVWRLTVSHPDGKPAAAQLMATLYDKSLEQLCKQEWSNINADKISRPPYTRWTYYTAPQVWGILQASWKSPQYKTLDISHLDSSILPDRYHNTRIFHTLGMKREAEFKASGPVKQLAAMKVGSNVVYDAATTGKGEVVEEMADEDADNASEKEGDTGDAGLQLRENLNETAFFFPALSADTTGTVSLDFTLPESVTTWQFIGMAHTANMERGILKAEAIARKDIMVQPNMPRFVRVGDKAVIPAKILNTGDRDINGKVKIELIDPVSEKTVFSQVKAFTTKAGSTSAEHFVWIPEESQTLLVCRITAYGKQFSDGEQHYLPVLSDREQVTKAYPFILNGKEEKRINLNRLIPPTASSPRLTLEYTANPAWLTIQALPSIATPNEENAISLAAAYFSNTLAVHILKRNPKAKDIFKLWQQEKGNSTSLTAQLEKNQELKDILLNETPWIEEADNESEQRRRLGEYFNENLINNRNNALLAGLKKLQNPDGSFSWWPKMAGNSYITTEIANTLARLNKLAGNQTQTSNILKNALTWMDNETIETVRRMKENEQKGQRQMFPGQQALKWLYIHALQGDRPDKNVQEAADYLVKLLKKDAASLSIYEKAMAAIVINRHGDRQQAMTLVSSMKEYTVFTEQDGRYYDTPRANYNWCDNRIPTQTAVIEALSDLSPEDRQTINEMQQWLLTQKRGQQWTTPIHSINAVYAFMKDNSRTLDATEQTDITLDGKPTDLPEGTAALGYIKTDITPGKGKTLKAGKQKDGIAWGAVYAQFTQKSTDVEDNGSDISIKREIIGEEQLKTGSRIKIRLTIECKRALDFVQVTDRRAACLEPVNPVSEYRNGAYVAPKDNATTYFFDHLSKGRHVVTTSYFIVRTGTYQMGTCTAECAYAPEYRATTKGGTIVIAE